MGRLPNYQSRAVAWSKHTRPGRRPGRNFIFCEGATARGWNDLAQATATEPGGTIIFQPLREGDSEHSEAGLWLGVNMRVQAAAQAEWSFFA